MLSLVSHHKRGGSRSSRTLGAGCDGRKALKRNHCADEQRICGRRSRVVLALRCRRQAREDAFKRLAGDGGNQAWSPGRSRISRNTIAQGMPAVAVYPWLLTPVLSFCTGGHGCNAHPAFPAPSLISRAVHFQHLGHFVPRERTVAPRSLPTSSRTSEARSGTHSHRTLFCEDQLPSDAYR